MTVWPPRTLFPKLQSASLGLFWNYQFVLLNPFTLFTQSLKPFTSGNHESVLRTDEAVSVVLICEFCSLDVTCT